MENDKWKLCFSSATLGSNRKGTSVTPQWHPPRTIGVGTPQSARARVRNVVLPSLPLCTINDEVKALGPKQTGGSMSAIETQRSLDAVVREYAFPDLHIGAGEDESPYVPFIENVFIRHLAFDVRNNLYANILWVKKGGMLGRHRHRGRIFACTLEGSWRYLEYDWVARPGSYVQESPGAVHTLVSDDPNGMKTMFVLNGSLEFVDENDNLLETLDVFWFINHYVSYCREHGIEINKKLWV
jgi:2,4'-dihydroxyacetophenone dioxygenase